ncbi:hypothetical protein [Aneurinibacillus migulanus]|uniref:hypothetical protein n=1 Tax=Aneurinibacillus migulanus TaxID=47500 RepID=UPI0020A0897C|nr:hypothetical protein [Aneurinibacillus migulanus]MCP1355067.1 hypothetical protein [Aneurinibacillus migulanus]
MRRGKRRPFFSYDIDDTWMDQTARVRLPHENRSEWERLSGPVETYRLGEKR